MAQTKSRIQFCYITGQYPDTVLLRHRAVSRHSSVMSRGNIPIQYFYITKPITRCSSAMSQLKKFSFEPSNEAWIVWPCSQSLLFPLPSPLAFCCLKRAACKCWDIIYPPLDGGGLKQVDPNTRLQIDSSSNTKESGCNTGTFQLAKDTNPIDVTILPAKKWSRHDEHVEVDETQHGFRTLKKTKILTKSVSSYECAVEQKVNAAEIKNCKLFPCVVWKI